MAICKSIQDLQVTVGKMFEKAQILKVSPKITKEQSIGRNKALNDIILIVGNSLRLS
jgi:hypothetical protein